jgi:hypothetical protein
MSGPYTAPKEPLSLKRKNCIIGIYAAMRGSNWAGFTGKCLLKNKFEDHPRKHAVMTPFECHIEAGIPP